jgi:hypothetical protein
MPTKITRRKATVRKRKATVRNHACGPQEGDLRVWNVVNPPNEGERYPVKSPQHAHVLISALADSQLLQEDVVSNAFGLEVFHDGEWEEWYSGDGEDIGDYVDELPTMEQLVKALQPIVHFMNKFDQKPTNGIDDRFYGIHAGTEWEANLTRTNFREIRSIVERLKAKPV